MFRSATFRITLVTVAITMAISVLFSVTIYHFATGALQFSAERQYLRLRRTYTTLSSKPPSLAMGSEQTEAAQNLLLNLVYLNVVILGVSTIIGAYLARRILNPIEQAMRLQGQFAADASHELRTPLAAMRSEIEVTLRDKQIPEADARQLLASNLEEIAKLEGLASGLLQLARLESSAVDFVPTKITPTIIAAIDDLKLSAKPKRFKLNHSGSDFTIMGQPGSLTQLIKILLDNAIKYGKAGGSANVSTKTVGHKGIIIVSDDGPGIAMGDLTHVFERFWRASTSRTKHQADGYGLGLAIAKEIVLLHSGEIKVDSKTGKGTVFTIELPLT